MLNEPPTEEELAERGDGLVGGGAGAGAPETINLSAPEKLAVDRVSGLRGGACSERLLLLFRRFHLTYIFKCINLFYIYVFYCRIHCHIYVLNLFYLDNMI